MRGRAHARSDIVVSGLRATRAAVAAIVERGGGAIVNVASVNSFFHPDVIDYVAAKAALLNVAKALSQELGPKGIRSSGHLARTSRDRPLARRPRRPPSSTAQTTRAGGRTMRRHSLPCSRLATGTASSTPGASRENASPGQVRSIKEETMTSIPHSIETPKTRMGSPSPLRRALEISRQTSIAVTSPFRYGKKENELKTDSTTLRSERLVTIRHAISRALSPEHHSTGLGLSRCSLCGSPCSPQGIHFCPRLYGR